MRNPESFASYDIYDTLEIPARIVEALDTNTKIINKSNSENRLYFQVNGSPSDTCKDIIDKTKLSIKDLSYYCAFTSFGDNTFLRIIQ